MCTLTTMTQDVDADHKGRSKVTRRERGTYRHGNLRAVLIEAGLQLARDGGPHTVVLRETTRRAAVAPNAAYRHFPNRAALLSAVSVRAQQVVVDEMDQYIAAALAVAPTEAAGRARAELDAVGRAYVHFALREPGLFATAFTVHPNLTDAHQHDQEQLPGPYRRLTEALDHCRDAGLIDPTDRIGAEVPAWSAVHGLAALLLDGPLRDLSAFERERALTRVLAMVHNGLERPPGRDRPESFVQPARGDQRRPDDKHRS
jgi:AcrR family transcriptional regulator